MTPEFLCRYDPHAGNPLIRESPRPIPAGSRGTLPAETGTISRGTAPSAQSTHRRPWRVVLYSHDAVGMGHTRRNLLIAQALAGSELRPGILCIAGACESTAFPLPSGADYVTLPSLSKGEDRQYRSRRLPLPVQELSSLRAKTIRAVLESFEPDVFIVDKVPRGTLGELDPVLESLRARGRTRCVLGLRDVLDDPLSVHREWRQAKNEDAIRRYYDAVWVYGDPTVYDLVREYRLSPDVAAKVRYTGYLDQCPRLDFARDNGGDPCAKLDLPPGRLMVCLLGGGEDGTTVAEAFVQADLPPDAYGVVLAGPMMPAEVRQRLHLAAAGRPRLRVIDFLTEPASLLQRADRIIAMGGYNTVCEVLSHGKRALIVPRVTPRQEQLIRAERLRDLGMLEVLHPDHLSPAALSEWLTRDIAKPAGIRERIDLNGLSRVPRLMAEMLGTSLPTASLVQPEEMRHALL